MALDEASNDLQNNAANASSCDVADVDAATSCTGCHSEQWAENRAHFPRGIDLLLVGDGMVTGLPRSTRIMEA